MKIILVFKTHFDIGFTDLASNVIRRYAGTMLDQVITTCKKTKENGPRRFVWSMPSWPLWYMLHHCEPEQKKELEQLIESGQVAWHALPFTSHTDFASPGEYLYGLKYSRMLAGQYQKPYPVSAKMTDVPGHSIMLPDLLSKAGVRFLHLGCNEFASPPKVPQLFYWEAPGGSRVLTMYSKGGYGTGLIPPKDWKYPVWMALMNTNDNSGPQSAEAIDGMVKEIQKTYPDAEIVCGTMDDFYRELEKCDLSGLPVVRKDLADTWIHGVGAYPAEVGMLREDRRMAEALEAVYGGRLLEKYSETTEKEAEKLWNAYYEQIMMFEEHTWGADVKTYLGPDRVYEKEAFQKARSSEAYQFMEVSWDEQRERIREADDALEKLKELLLKGEKEKIPEVQKEKKAAVFSIYQDKKACLKNHRYEIWCDLEKGQILRVYDKKLGENLLEARENEPVFGYRYDRYGYEDINEYLRAYGYHFTTWGIQDYGRENYPFCEHKTYEPQYLGYEKEPNGLTLRYAGKESVDLYGDARRTELKLELPETGDEIFVTLYLEEKEETPYVEAGSFLLPFAGKNAEYRIRKGGVTLNPETDIAEGANHSLYCLGEGAAVLNQKAGLWIESLDAPLIAIGTPGIYEYHPVFPKENSSAVYVNLFNNMWGTNFPQWIGGSFCFRFCLRGFAPEPEKKEIPSICLETADCAVKMDDPLRKAGLEYPEHLKLIHAESLGEQKRLLVFLEMEGKAKRDRIQAKGWRITESDLFGNPKVTDGEETGKEPCIFLSKAYGTSSFLLEREEI